MVKRDPLKEDPMREEKVELAGIAERRSWWRGFTAGAVFCLAVLLALGVLGQPSAFNVWKEGGLSPRQAEELVNKVDAVMRKLDENYLEELDDVELLDGAYHGLVSAVGDKYTRYYDEEEYKDYKESSSGQYVGIGVTVRLAETGGAQITLVEELGPAFEAGLSAGDIIVGADDNDLIPMELDQMVSLIKGDEGTYVKITYISAATGEQKVVDVERRTIESKTVKHEMLETGIGYLQIVSFDGVTTEQFKNALNKLKDENMKGLIIDLRDNPGGRLDVVNDIVDEILPAGIITYTEDKNGEQEIYYSDDESVLDLPLVLVVNENSASASEIMAGAIQDHEAGILVGTTTYGKGIVQVTSSFKDDTAIKVTTSKYYTPGGKYIHKIGITPDIQINLPEGMSFAALTSHDADIQLQTALEALKTQMAR